jgi:hypothetical protein
MAPSRLRGVFAPGAAVISATPITQFRPCAGVSKGRLRFKATAAGTLKVEYAAPDGVTVYTLPAAVTAAVIANTEVLLDWVLQGEAYYLLTFTPSANGNVTYCDECGL